MEYRPLGKTGLTMSRIAFGALTMGPLGANLSPDQAAALLEHALDSGVNFIDTAQHYRNYSLLAPALFDRGQPLIIACRSFAASYEEMAFAVEEARIGLQRNKIEIFMLHEIRNMADFRERAGAWQYLRDAKAVGVIGSIGISTHSAQVAEAAAAIEGMEVVHVLLNCRGVGILDGDLADMLRAVAKLRRAGIGVYGMKILGGGALMHQAREAFRWFLAQDDLSGAAVGFRDPAEIDAACAYLQGRDYAEEQKISVLDRNLVFDKEPRCHGCGKCVRRCPQGALTLDENRQAVWNKSLCLFCGYCIGECPWFCISFC
ncbi:MAG: aldo/keto reductase [Firmicutes bacterium]|nr:aldo/keto reductase [Bacillota bacterium]